MLCVTFAYFWCSDHLLFCLQTPSSLTDKYTSSEPCLSSSGTLIFPYLAIGGYQNEQYTQGKALILTFVIKNYEDRDSEDFKNALRWEEEFLKLVKAESEKLEFWDLAYYSESHRFQTQNLNSRILRLYKPVRLSRHLDGKLWNPKIVYRRLECFWNRERSIEDEIEEAASADLQIFIIAYSTIFIYLAIALGQYESFKTIPRDMKISLALSSIFMIFGAAFGSIGLFGWLGIQVSYLTGQPESEL